MGQGHYTALVYGMKGDPCDLLYSVDDDGYQEPAPWTDQATYGWETAYVKIGYESRTPWAGVFVGCSDSIVNERRGGGVDLEYEAYSLKDIESTFANQIHVSMAKWETFRKLAKDNGVDLPPGELMLVFDYD